MGHTFLEENEIKKARAEERARAVAILMGVARYDGSDNPPPCWCECCTGNPNAPTHDSGCEAARAYVSALVVDEMTPRGEAAAEPPQFVDVRSRRVAREIYADCERIARENDTRRWAILDAIAAKRKEVCGE